MCVFPNYSYLYVLFVDLSPGWCVLRPVHLEEDDLHAGCRAPYARVQDVRRDGVGVRPGSRKNIKKESFGPE